MTEMEIYAEKFVLWKLTQDLVEDLNTPLF